MSSLSSKPRSRRPCSFAVASSSAAALTVTASSATSDKRLGPASSSHASVSPRKTPSSCTSERSAWMTCGYRHRLGHMQRLSRIFRKPRCHALLGETVHSRNEVVPLIEIASAKGSLGSFRKICHESGHDGHMIIGDMFEPPHLETVTGISSAHGQRARLEHHSLAGEVRALPRIGGRFGGTLEKARANSSPAPLPRKRRLLPYRRLRRQMPRSWPACRPLSPAPLRLAPSPHCRWRPKARSSARHRELCETACTNKPEQQQARSTPRHRPSGLPHRMLLDRHRLSHYSTTSLKDVSEADSLALMRMFGFVSAVPSAGNSLTRSVPYFATRSSTSPKSRARIMQASTHTGLRPPSRSALQLSHFTMRFWSSTHWRSPVRTRVYAVYDSQYRPHRRATPHRSRPGTWHLSGSWPHRPDCRSGCSPPKDGRGAHSETCRSRKWSHGAGWGRPLPSPGDLCRRSDTRDSRCTGSDRNTNPKLMAYSSVQIAGSNRQSGCRASPSYFSKSTRQLL